MITSSRLSSDKVAAYSGLVIAQRCGRMKAPVLVVADATGAHVIRSALADLDVTVTDQVTRARGLASTGAFLAVFETHALVGSVPGAVELDPAASPVEIARAARAEIARTVAAQEADARNDDAGALSCAGSA